MPAAARILTTLALVWVYIVLAGAPPSAIRAGVVASLVLCASLIGRQVSPLHFMTTMLACVLAYNPLLVFNAGFQLSVAAVFGILLLRKPLESLVTGTLLRSFENPPRSIANLLAVTLAAQAATTPIVAASFDQVSLIGPLTNLIAVPLSGPILTLGLVASALGNVAPVLAYPLNVSNGFLVALLIWTAQAAAYVPVCGDHNARGYAGACRVVLRGLRAGSPLRRSAAREAGVVVGSGPRALVDTVARPGGSRRSLSSFERDRTVYSGCRRLQ